MRTRESERERDRIYILKKIRKNKLYICLHMLTKTCFSVFLPPLLSPEWHEQVADSTDLCVPLTYCIPQKNLHLRTQVVVTAYNLLNQKIDNCGPLSDICLIKRVGLYKQLQILPESKILKIKKLIDNNILSNV